MAAIQRFTTNMGKRLGLKVIGRYREVAAIRRFTTNMGKRLGLKVIGRYREVAAIRRLPRLEVRLYSLLIIVYLYCFQDRFPEVSIAIKNISVSVSFFF